MEDALSARVRFGEFDLDVKTGELSPVGGQDGPKVLLQEQPFQVLRLLIEHAGEIVTHQEIKGKLWPNDTVVDFDHGINGAIATLRRVLGDSAEEPQYIETVARRPGEDIDYSFRQSGWRPLRNSRSLSPLTA